MNRFDFTQLGGFPLEQDSLQWMQDGYIAAINAQCDALFGWLNEPVILSGCVLSGGVNPVISDGWVYHPSLGVMQFYGGAYPQVAQLPGGGQSNIPGVLFTDTAYPLEYGNGSTQHTRIERAAHIGIGGFPLAAFLQNRIVGDWRPGILNNNQNGVSGSIQYRRNLLTRSVELRGTLNRTANANVGNYLTLYTLPTGYMPTAIHSILLPVHMSLQAFYLHDNVRSPMPDLFTQIHPDGRIETRFWAATEMYMNPLFTAYFNHSFPIN